LTFAALSGEAALASRTFGRYQLRELVAVSGMGVVYRAWDPTLACVVAIKLVRENTIPDETARRQLYTEARIASSLNHANICRIKDVIEESGQAGIVWSLSRGRFSPTPSPPMSGFHSIWWWNTAFRSPTLFVTRTIMT